MTEYTHDELLTLFLLAAEMMASDGIISPTEYKTYIANMSKWLAEELDN